MKPIWNVLKTNFFAGLLVILPAGATLWLVMTLWTWLDKPLRQFFGLFNTPETLTTTSMLDRMVAWMLAHGIDLGGIADVPGLGLILTLAIIFFLGLIARSLLGRTFINLGEKILNRLPIVGSVYKAMKQLLEAVFSENSKAFRKAVLIQFPHEGIWTIAFMSNLLPPSITKVIPEKTPDARDLAFCFVPTTPNPTSGWLVAVRQCEVHPLDISIDDAVKIIISGGIYAGSSDDARAGVHARLGTGEEAPESR